MANTHTLFNSGIAFAVSKVMAGILNGGARVLRIARMGMLNNQTGAVTGVACFMELRRYPATFTWTGSTAVAPVSHDTTNSALSSVTAGNSGTPGGSTGAVLRRIFWSSDEPAASTATSDELQCFVPLNVIWDAGYGDTTVQKVALRNVEGIALYNTVGAAGIVDIWTEFLDEAS